MTLIETVIAAFLLGLVLFVAAEGADYIRDQLKTARTWELLARLDEALTAYHDATGAWPGEAKDEGERGRAGEGVKERARDGAMESGSDGGSGRRAETDGSERTAVRVIAALRQAPASRAILEQIEADAPGRASEPILRDAWGRPLRCLTAASPSAVDRLAVAANGGRPIFISDGTARTPAEQDNPTFSLRSDGLPR